ncbi:MAG: winged helix-turn-helix domain-containing protein [Oscillospiraceae bacterium]|nr:winged helix-turn-helix domain-containing protein [Oscillospiraceae bacterium]
MTARQIIEMAVAYCGITNSELARRLDWSPQLLNKRLNTGKLTVEEWETIGKALGGSVKIRFVIDGNEVGL